MTESESRKLLEEVARIKVVYQDGYGYRVNKPQWDGGEVVMASDYDKLAALLRERLEAERWIPCSERLPEKDGKYLCWHADEMPVISYFAAQSFWNEGEAQDIIFWKPIAAPEVQG